MTRANERKPTIREVDGGEHGILIVEIGEKTIRIRPKGKRRGKTFALWGPIYRRLLWADAQAALPPRRAKRRVSRSLLRL